jgi:2-polyprenyl-3-methyl-5-hydroxy-6-metoxy-1,4-benzoquinol methylase
MDELIVGDMEEIDFTQHFKEKMFDTFVFGDVLEHLQEPDTLLKKTRPFLNDDGFILASIPNVGYAGIIFDLLQGEFNYSKEGLLDRSHIRFFTKDEVYYLFERTGFYISNIDRVITERKLDLSIYRARRKDFRIQLNQISENQEPITKNEVERSNIIGEEIF